MKPDARNHSQKKEVPRNTYTAPKLTVYGTVEKLTGWVGGPWGEFLGGQGSGWNPWACPHAS